ncbi:MAG: hypothetical protein GY712_13430 [Oceanicoccus sp.]|uniref:hypothetical protein n=1 Tax=Oceanicoccus sp. TaxID=2691044 RepID=UPI0026054F5B|nr:hypothetical protein [Oceanicoccus sp.]MCP3909006.1 hypothetical protein [Oceanicoccus sp.]MDG1771970.1 hypothetical protein [Oceanicoccus sp.]
MQSEKINVEEILARAATQHITADELDLLVTKTRELSQIRERELKHLRSLLYELESHLYHH